MPGRRGKQGVKEGSPEAGIMKLPKKMLHYGCLALYVLAWHAGCVEHSVATFKLKKAIFHFKLETL